MSIKQELKTAAKLKYRRKTYYLLNSKIYDAKFNVIIEDARNGFLDLYEYYEYFEPNQQIK